MDRTEARRLSDVAALLPVHLILPEVSQLVFGAPGERRRCLDWGLFHVKPRYLSALRDYLGTLRQRNAALKSLGQPSLGPSVDIWTESLVREAEAVHEHRSGYVAGLMARFQAAISALEPGLLVELDYKNGWGEENLAKVLGDTLQNDVKLGSTGAGPHRADLSMTVDGRSAGVTLSRGQGKLVAIALDRGSSGASEGTGWPNGRIPD